jgi:5-methylcytosine-specific restriction endonuclease McrA
MTTYSLTHLSDGTLLRGLAALVARDRANTAQLLAHIAEVDARRLYAPAGFPSMFAYCVHELRLSEQAAFNRIRAARIARQFPAIYAAVTDGRLNLSAVVLLSPYLTAQNADELLSAVANLSKSEIERLIATRFPRPDLPARVQAFSSPATLVEVPDQLSPGIVEPTPTELRVSTQVEESAARVLPPRVTRLAPERFALQLTISQATRDKLRKAQALLSHRIPSGDLAGVLDRALDALIERLEKRKFAATRTPRSCQARSKTTRTIPALVKRAVWQRDHGQCTFVSDSGHRCTATDHLEFDHVEPVARGGHATVENTRLLCRAHNQYQAERTFRAEFMRRKRDQAAEARRAAAEEKSENARKAVVRRSVEEVIPWLRQLGYSQSEARARAERCETMPDASLEERVRAALSFVSPRVAFRSRAMPPSSEASGVVPG